MRHLSRPTGSARVIRRRSGKGTALAGGVAVALSLASVAGCNKDQLQGAKAEVQETSIKLDLPAVPDFVMPQPNPDGTHPVQDRKSTRLNSSHVKISYAVFCLKKKNVKDRYRKRKQNQ